MRGVFSNPRNSLLRWFRCSGFGWRKNWSFLSDMFHQFEDKILSQKKVFLYVFKNTLFVQYRWEKGSWMGFWIWTVMLHCEMWGSGIFVTRLQATYKNRKWPIQVNICQMNFTRAAAAFYSHASTEILCYQKWWSDEWDWKKCSGCNFVPSIQKVGKRTYLYLEWVA